MGTTARIGTKGTFHLTQGQLSITSSMCVEVWRTSVVVSDGAHRVLHLDGGGNAITTTIVGFDMSGGDVGLDQGGVVRVDDKGFLRIFDTTVRHGRANFGGGPWWRSRKPRQPRHQQHPRPSLRDDHRQPVGGVGSRPRRVPGGRGGIFNLGRVRMSSSVVAGNLDSFPVLSPWRSPDCHSPSAGGFTSQRHNTVGALNDLCLAVDDDLGDLTGIDHGTVDDPLDPHFSARFTNGGQAYYNLLATSPALDTGAGPGPGVGPALPRHRPAAVQPAGGSWLRPGSGRAPVTAIGVRDPMMAAPRHPVYGEPDGRER